MDFVRIKDKNLESERELGVKISQIALYNQALDFSEVKKTVAE